MAASPHGDPSVEPVVRDVATLRVTIDVTHRRARLAMWGVGGVTLFKVATPLLTRWLACPLSTAQMHVLALNFVEFPVWITGAVLFCRWLHRAYEDNSHLGGRPLKFSPSYAVGSFFIPVVNLWQPYQAIRDLYVASDPRPLPDPPRFSPSSEVLYRSSGRELVPPPKWNRTFPLRSWWACYIVVPLALRLLTTLGVFWRLTASVARASILWSVTGSLAIGLHLASAVLAILVIRSIQARQEERLRRLEVAQETQRPASPV